MASKEKKAKFECAGHNSPSNSTCLECSVKLASLGIKSLFKLKLTQLTRHSVTVRTTIFSLSWLFKNKENLQILLRNQLIPAEPNKKHSPRKIRSTLCRSRTSLLCNIFLHSSAQTRNWWQTELLVGTVVYHRVSQFLPVTQVLAITLMAK